MMKFLNLEVFSKTAVTLGIMATMLIAGNGCKTYQKTVDWVTPTKPAPVLSSRGGTVPAPYAKPPEQQPPASTRELPEFSEEEMPASSGISPLPDFEEEEMAFEEFEEEAKEEEEGLVELEDVEPESLTHTVQKGESLWKIGQKYDVSFQELAAYNNMDTDEVLSVGTKLRIPPGGSSPDGEEEGERQASAAEEGTSGSASSSDVEKKPIPPNNKYTVKAGDSLWRVSRMFGVSMDKIRSLNDLDSDTLQVGQVLVLKEDDEGGSSSQSSTTTPRDESGRDDEEGESGDSRDQSDMSALEREPLDEDESPEPEAEEEAEEYSFPKTLQHTVSADETLDMIADMYETSEDKIKKANKDVQSSEDLETDMTITIPYE